jgi:hypothetical protein
LSSVSHVFLPALICIFDAVPSPVPRADSLSISRWFWPSLKRGAPGQFRDIGQVPSRTFDWLPFTPFWSPSPVLQLVSELICSPVSFNRLCDLKVTSRNVMLSLWSSMARISVTGKTELVTISCSRATPFGRLSRRHT